MLRETLYISLALVCVLNVVITIYIGRRPDLEKQQKLFQILLVWLIPVIASISLWVINRNFDTVGNMQSKSDTPYGGVDASSHYSLESDSNSSGE